MLATFLHLGRDGGCFTGSEVSDFCWFLREKCLNAEDVYHSSFLENKMQKNRHLWCIAVGWCRTVSHAERKLPKLTITEKLKGRSSIINMKIVSIPNLISFHLSAYLRSLGDSRLLFWAFFPLWNENKLVIYIALIEFISMSNPLFNEFLSLSA